MPWNQLGEATKSKYRSFFRMLGPYEPIISPNEAPANKVDAARAIENLMGRQPASGTTPAQQSAYARLQSQTTRATLRSGLFGSWTSSALIKTGLAAGAFATGYGIGSGLNAKVFGFGIPDDYDFSVGAIEDVRIFPVSPGETWNGGMTEQLYGLVPDIGFQYAWLEEGETQRDFVFTAHADNCPNGTPGGGDFPNPIGSGTEIVPNGPSGNYFCGFSEFPPFEPIRANNYSHGVWDPLTITHGIVPVGTPGAPSVDRDLQVQLDPGDAGLDQALDLLFASPEFEDLDRWLQKQMEPEQNEDDPDPFDGLVAIPDCTGLSYNACVTALQAAGFGVFEQETLSFNDALPMPQGQPGQLVRTSPLAGTRVQTSTLVQIMMNPEEPEMPRLVPAPGPREHHQDYEQRTTELGLVPTNVFLDTTLGDPQRGPEEVVTTSPVPGTRVPKNEPVTVRTNPPDWPAPGGGGSGGCDPHAIRAFDLGPLSVPLTGAFPFGVFHWIGEALDAWLVTPAAPIWTFDLTDQIEWEVSFTFLQPAMVIIRPVILIVSALGLVWLLAASAMRINAPPED